MVNNGLVMDVPNWGVHGGMGFGTFDCVWKYTLDKLKEELRCI